MNRIISRVRGLLLAPRDELVKTVPESGALKAQLVPFVLVSSGVGPIAQFLSEGVIGTYHPPTTIFNTPIPATMLRAPGPAAAGAVLRYGLTIGAWLVLAAVLDLLAPRFGAQHDPGGARKAATVIATPFWLSGVLLLFASVPYLGVLIPVGTVAALAYGVLLGVWAVPHHLGTPEVKAVGHVLSSLAIAGCATAVAGCLLGWLLL